MAKYSIIAFILWLTLGGLGVHHFYLGRDNQGLLWLTSFGGMFGVGWIRDFTRIRGYVKEANAHPQFLSDYGRLLRGRKRPSVWKNLFRVVGQVSFGWFYRGLVMWALPEEYAENSFVVLLFAPLGSAFGTYMVSNVGVIKCRWKYSVLGAYLGELLFGYHHMIMYAPVPSLAVSVSMLFSTFGWEFDRRPLGQNVIRARSGRCCRGERFRRVSTWAVVLVVYSLLICSFLYFNAAITTPEGESVKVREAVNNFLKSPYWERLKKSFWLNSQEVWEEFKMNGWHRAIERLMVLADFQGEQRSRYLLRVEANSTLSEVKSKYRELVKEWHPDKHLTDSAQERARVQEKFMDITEAYEILQKIYKKRERGSSYRGRG